MTREQSDRAPLLIAATGIAALAIAMGIGRFAFTPLLPMMMADGVVDISGASWLASANYLGYLVGALACTVQPWLDARLGRAQPPSSPAVARAGLACTAVLTAAMALELPGAWPALRFAAGVASAYVLIHASSWCVGTLSHLGRPSLAALMFTGPGAGIVASGLAASAMVAMNWRASVGWLLFGVLAAMLTAAVWGRLRPLGTGFSAPVAQQAGSGSTGAHGMPELALLSMAYGLAGFGYIITATFLPVIARQALPGSPWLDLFWPVFGTGIIIGAVSASRMRRTRDLRVLLAGCYLVQAAGVTLSLALPTHAGFALGSLLLGLPFTAITFFAVQEVRRVRPAQAASFMGLITAAYGFGQIIGPPLAAALVARSGSFTPSLQIAAGALVFGALLYGVLARLYPTPFQM